MPSSRYQSTVLRFVAQQSLRLRDRALKGVRQVRMAAVWGAQIALYPIYAIFQTTRLVGKQLEQTTRQIFPKLAAAIDPDRANSSASADPSQAYLPPKSDRPIENLLEALEQWQRFEWSSGNGEGSGNRGEGSGNRGETKLLGGGVQGIPNARARELGFLVSTQPTGLATAQSSTSELPTSELRSSELRSTIQLPTIPPPTQPIQGIATLLVEKQIVLVDTHNHVHNVLTPDQQAALQQRIVLEVAEYWRDRREYAFLSGTSNSPLGRRFLPLPKERKNMLPPVRYLRRFIAWMQTSPMAIATNVFQESALVPTRQAMGQAMGAGTGQSMGQTMDPPISQAMEPSMAQAMMEALSKGMPDGWGALSPSTFAPLEPAPKLALAPSAAAVAPYAVAPLPTPLYPFVSSQRSLDVLTGLSPSQFSSDQAPFRQILSNQIPSSPPSQIPPLPPRQSLWGKLLNWITATPNRPEPNADPSVAKGAVPNGFVFDGPTSPQSIRYLNQYYIQEQVLNGYDVNGQPIEISAPASPELAPDLWFDPDFQGSEDGWFNANHINQVRRQREFPHVVPSLPSRVSPAMQSSPLDASYAHIEANLTERVDGGLITTHQPQTIEADDIAQSRPFPESAAAMLNVPGTTPDPVSLENYLAHHGAAYDFRRTEELSGDRNVLYRVSADAETSVHSDTGPFPLDIPGQPRADVTNTWLDTTAEVVGYDKHPLERLLGWVDSGMAWIESRIASVWYWVRDRF